MINKDYWGLTRFTADQLFAMQRIRWKHEKMKNKKIPMLRQKEIKLIAIVKKIRQH